jgi:hypothetical protein
MVREYDEPGVVKQGMDLPFCSEVRTLDLKTYRLCDYLSRHFEQVDLYEVTQLLVQQRDSQLQRADSPEV